MITVETKPIDEETARYRMHELRSIVESWRDHWHTAHESLERAAKVVDSDRVFHWDGHS